MLSFKERRYRENLELSRKSFIQRAMSRMLSSINLHEMFATWFFCGKLAFAQGSLGSLATYPLYYIIFKYSGSISQLSINLLYISLMLLLIAAWSIPRYTSKIKTHDHPSIVIDEVIGQLLTISMSATSIIAITTIFENKIGMHIYHFIFLVSFFCFRLFDIAKPLGIKLIDKLMKNTFGIIFDDIIAALYSALTLAITAKILMFFK